MPCIRLRVAVYDDDPIAVETQFDEDELDGGRMNPTCRGRSFRRNRIKGVRIEKSQFLGIFKKRIRIVNNSAKGDVGNRVRQCACRKK